MEIVAGLKQVDGQLSLMIDRVSVVSAKLEDLLYRAQRISAAIKNGVVSTDIMYGYDLQNFRQSLRTFAMDLATLPPILGSLERQASYNLEAVKFAQSVMRNTSRMAQALKALHEMALLAHQHIRTADHKMHAWHISKEIEEMALQMQGLPMSANRVLIASSTPKAD
jgi:hypothetical protein